MQVEIEISKNQGKVECVFTRENVKRQIWTFDLLTVLGDFVAIRQNYVDGNGNDRLRFNYLDHIFTNVADDLPPYNDLYNQDYYYEEVKSAFICIDNLIESVVNKENLRDALFSFETLKSTLNITFAYSVEVKKIENNFGDIASFGAMNNFIELENRTSIITYKCLSVTDMVASIIHYYMLNDYRLTKCKHCEKWFATKTLKSQYCQRMSTMKQYSQKPFEGRTCEQVTKNAKQYIKRTKNQIASRIRMSKEFDLRQSDTIKLFNDFHKQCDKYSDTISKSPTGKNLMEYITYLNSFRRE